MLMVRKDQSWGTKRTRRASTMSAMVLGLSMVLAMTGIPTAVADGPVITPVDPDGCAKAIDKGTLTYAEVEVCWDVRSSGCRLTWQLWVREVDLTDTVYNWEMPVDSPLGGDVEFPLSGSGDNVNHGHGVEHGIGWGEKAEGTAMIQRDEPDATGSRDTSLASLTFDCS